MINKNSVIQGDCLEVMKDIEDKSVDMILCDLPYGTTACSWDTIIPFEPLWEQYKRIIKDNGAIALTASQPFTSKLVMSNLDMFKYEWIWEKEQGTNFLLKKYYPLKSHENILIFGNKIKYNPQAEKGKPFLSGNGESVGVYGKTIKKQVQNYGTRLPKTVIRINREVGKHPTQKPVALFSYLIKTYTNEGDLVLDNCAGSGTTAIACINTNRNYILIEQEKKYINIINKRISDAKQDILYCNR